MEQGALAGLCPACLLHHGADTESGVGTGSNTFTPPAVAELAPLFPQLELIEFIGKGGMGAVYKARQKHLDRIVALKILPPGIGEAPAFAERFVREAKALALLNHPGIVTLYEFGASTVGEGALYFFLMEYVDGVNLRELLRASRVSPREALAIVPQICDALQFAHDHGIVHRDIKPENILLDRRGRVKVADFGLAKITESLNPSFVPPIGKGAAPIPADSPPSSGALTDAGKTMGTPSYMAPEQAEHPSEVDHRADIYALGVVFYQMLTGELPGQPLQPPSSKVQVDVRLDEIVLRALERKPELRYQQASVIKTQVETLAAESRIPEAAPTNAGVAEVARKPWIAFCLALTYAGTLLFGVACELFRGSTPGGWLLAGFVLVALASTGLALILDRLASSQVHRAAFRIAAWLAFLTALPVICFAGFFLYALTQDNSGWHPALPEAAIVPLCWLGAALLPICVWRFRQAANQMAAYRQARAVVPARSIAAGAAIIGLVGGAVFLVLLAMAKSSDQKLSGKVLDGVTGNPLSQAIVAVARIDENQELRQTRTDSSGRYYLHWPGDTDLLYWRGGVRHGVDLTFSASAPGYETGHVFLSQIEPTSNGRRAFDFALHPTAHSSLLPDKTDMERMANELRRRLQQRGFRFDGMLTSPSDQPSQWLLNLEGLRLSHRKNGTSVWESAMGYLIAEPLSNGGWHVQGRQQIEDILFTLEPDSNTWRTPILSEIKTVSAPMASTGTSNGLELVGLSFHPSTDQPWWQKDGSLLKTGFTSQGRSINPEGQGFELVFHHGELSDDVAFKLESLPPNTSISGMEPPLREGKPVENHRLYVVHVPPGSNGETPRTLTLNVGIAAGEWTTLARRSATAGQSGAYTLEDGGICQLIFADPVETTDETRITVSHNTLRNWETRVSAWDLAGKEYLSPRHHTSMGDMASTAGHFKGLRPDQVKEFRFEIRPYHWVEFRNVSLRPGTSTPVEVRDILSD